MVKDQLLPHKKAVIRELSVAGPPGAQTAKWLDFASSTITRPPQQNPDDVERREGTEKKNSKTMPRQDEKPENLCLSGRFKTANEVRDE